MADFFTRLFEADRDAILLAAAIYFVVMGVVAVANLARLSRWPSTEGRLEGGDVERTSSLRFDASDQEYKAAVRYRYRVDGQEYAGTRLNPWQVVSTHNLKSLLKFQYRGIERLGGDRVRVHYNPGNPAKSYLDVPGPLSMAVVGGLCFCAALLLWLAGD